VRLNGVGDREHGVPDLLVLLATVCLALATWASLAETSSVPAWKSFISVIITLLLALAALTRNPDWAASIRFLTGGWLIAAPFILKFDDIAPALWTYLAIGTLVAALATPGIAARLAGRVGMTA
jgi:hypothetical protein